MCCWRRRARPDPSIALLLVLSMVPAQGAAQIAPALPASPAATTLILDLVVDGRPQAEPVVVQRVGEAFSVPAASLEAAGVDVGDRVGNVSLANIPGLVATFDEREQRLALRTGKPSVTSLSSEAEHPAPLTATAWGGFVNYDVTADANQAGASVAGSFEGVLFTPRGYGFAGAIANTNPQNGRLVRRTDTGFTSASASTLRRITLGDFINDAASNSRPIRMAGIKVGTDFSVRPDLITFPLPSVSGTAAVPSTIDLLVNGSRQPTIAEGGGPFTLTDIPVQVGFNTISVAVRDELGRPTVHTVTTYAARELLRPGLSAYSAELGFVRVGYLTPRDRYRAPAATGTWRRGFDETLTLEGHVELSPDLATVEMTALHSLGWLGLTAASIGIVKLNNHPGTIEIGTRLTIGLERIARPISLSAKYERTSHSWGDLAARYGSLTRADSLALSLGFDLRRFGTLGINLLALSSGRSAFDGQGYRVGDGARAPASMLFNASYSARISQRIGVLATFGTDRRRRQSTYASLGATLVLDSRSSAYLGISRSAAGTMADATASRSALVEGDWGYRAGGSAGAAGAARIGGAIQHLGRTGLIEAAAETVNGNAAGEVTLRGAMVYTDGRAFPMRTLTDSFAVVDTAGQRDVTIYRDNHRVGRTDAHGLLVVPDLAAFQSTTFSIDPTAIDPSLAIDRTETAITPGQRVGVHVSFALVPDASVLFTVVDDVGAPMPLGSDADFAGNKIVIGLSGQAYFSPRIGGTLFIRLPSGRRCAATVPARTAISGGETRLSCLRPGSPNG